MDETYTLTITYKKPLKVGGFRATYTYARNKTCIEIMPPF